MSAAAINYSLDKIRKLLGILPPFTRPTVHVAGTNGKGSTTALVESILNTATFRTGRFNSPHMVDPWDCIYVNRLPVTREKYVSTRSMVEKYDRSQSVDASNFEILTATALMIFEEERVDIAILECGMGGRLDATNAIPDDVVLVSAVTSVDLDHQGFLGNTVAEIAAEKAHIARRGRPLVLGPQKHASVGSAVADVVSAIGGHLIVAREARIRMWDERIDGEEPPRGPFRPGAGRFPPAIPIIFDTEPPIRALLNLQGRHQVENLSTALTIIDILRQQQPFSQMTADDISEGIRTTRWPGRLSWVELETAKGRRAILMDAAHNPAGSKALAEYLDTLSDGPRTYLISLSHSPPKTPFDTLRPLLRNGDKVAVLQFSSVDGMPWVKPCDPEDIRSAATQLVGPLGEAFRFRSIADAVSWAVKDDCLLIVAGSIYLLSDFERFLRQSERA